jgi:hypothetical protein
MNWLKRKTVRYIFIAGVIIISALALLDSIGYFNPKPYRKVSMGSNVYYVPKDRNPNVDIDKFPTVKPLPSETITPNGQLVSKDSLKSKKE